MIWSIPKITSAIIIAATNTNTALLCSSRHVGQVTFSVNSMYDSLIYSATPAIFILCLSTGTRIRTLIKGFGDLYSTVELFPCIIIIRKHKFAVEG
jgi:hypothetical protein